MLENQLLYFFGNLSRSFPNYIAFRSEANCQQKIEIDFTTCVKLCVESPMITFLDLTYPPPFKETVLQYFQIHVYNLPSMPLGLLRIIPKSR
jgi:hypothetical protein